MIVVGGTGTIGKAVVNELKQRHEIIVAGHNHGVVIDRPTQPLVVERCFFVRDCCWRACRAAWDPGYDTFNLLVEADRHRRELWECEG